MTKKADFNAEDWSVVTEGPVLAGMRVAAAERGGSVRESLAMGRVYQEARRQQGASELIDEIVASPPSLDRTRSAASHGDELPEATRDQLRRAIRILEEKASSAEVDDYKRFVMTVAQEVAAAHKEGGFLGIGGTPVSEAEDKALDEISIALGPPPADGVVS